MNLKTIRAGRAMALAATLTMISAIQALATTPEQACEAGKNDAAGKYAACAEKAYKGLVATGDMTKFSTAQTKCETKLASGWDKLEAAAVANGTTCPSIGDQAAVGDFVDACVTTVAAALSGSPLPTDVTTCNDDLAYCNAVLAGCDGDLASCASDLSDADADLATCQGDLTTCDASLPDIRVKKTGQTTCYDGAGSTISCAGTGQDGAVQAGATASYTDNGDGTITDHVTGLMWEKLSDDTSIHDKDNTYSGVSGSVAKAASLNGMAFAGHSDWRLPNRRELMSIVDYGHMNPAVLPVFNTGCSAGCSVLSCSCTKNFVYTSSSSYLEYTPANWKINFQDGDVFAGNRTDTYNVRAVRTAS
jgi:hypothetical protein